MSDRSAESGESRKKGADAQSAPAPRRLGSAAALLAGSVLLSRVLGYARDAVLAIQVGVGPESDAFFAGFQLPDMLNYLMAGGALTIAFTPLYLERRNRQGPEAGQHVFDVVFGTVTLVTVVGTALLYVYADVFVDRMFAGFDAVTRAHTVALTRTVLPAQVFIISGGIVRAVLIAHGYFGAMALAPLLYNLAMIVGGLVTGSVEGFAWGVLVGSFFGHLIVPLVHLRKVCPLRPRIAPLDEAVRRYLWLALPLMIGVSLATVDEWYERWFGSALQSGTVAALSLARKLMMLPVAVVGQAVAAAALPTLADLHSRGEQGQLDSTLLRTLQATLFLAVVSAAGMWIFATPILQLFFEHGEFLAEDTARVSALLRVLVFAIPAWIAQQIAVRAFYARGDTWRPMALGTLVALGAIPVYLQLRESSGAIGLAWAGVGAMSVNALATLAWARVRYGGPALSGLVDSGWRGVAIAVAAGMLARVARVEGEGVLGAVFEIATGGFAFLIVVSVGVRVLGDPVSRDAIARVVARVTGRRLPRVSS